MCQGISRLLLMYTNSIPENLKLEPKLKKI
jgi:hypothetical protein